ncbi:hypothetical protein Hanom_Chr15g01405511 [Helianthus anomalus]
MELVSEELREDCKWLLNQGVPIELAKYMLELGDAAYKSGRQDGYADRKVFTLENKQGNDFEWFKEDCMGTY